MRWPNQINLKLSAVRLITPHKSGVQIKIEETIYKARNYKRAGSQAGITATGRWKTHVIGKQGHWKKRWKWMKRWAKIVRCKRRSWRRKGWTSRWIWNKWVGTVLVKLTRFISLPRNSYVLTRQHWSKVFNFTFPGFITWALMLFNSSEHQPVSLQSWT